MSAQKVTAHHSPPSVCAFNINGTGFVAATTRGLRAYAISAAAVAPTVTGQSDAAQLCRAVDPPPTPAAGHFSCWTAGLPVEAVAQAGSGPTIAVIFGATGAANDAAESSYPTVTDEAGGPPAFTATTDGTAGQALRSPTAALSSRKYVHLFDAPSGALLAELFFRGATVCDIRATHSLLVAMLADSFHVIDINTLRHVWQEPMRRPLNPRWILAVAKTPPSVAVAVVTPPQAEADRNPGGGSTSSSVTLITRIAFPCSDRGHGDVTVMTIAATVTTETEAATGALPSLVSSSYTESRVSIACHRQPITALCLRTLPGGGGDRTLLLTASASGTSIRLFDAGLGGSGRDGGGWSGNGCAVPLCEFLRGQRPASVVALAMGADGATCAALSSRRTLHVFDCSAAVREWCRTGQPPAKGSAAQQPRAFMKRQVTPLFSVQDIGAGDAGAPDTATSPSRVCEGWNDGAACHLAYSLASRHVWVAQHGQLTRAGGGGNSAAAAMVSHERCTLQRFDLKIPYGDACDELELVV